MISQLWYSVQVTVTQFFILSTEQCTVGWQQQRAMHFIDRISLCRGFIWENFLLYLNQNQYFSICFERNFSSFEIFTAVFKIMHVERKYSLEYFVDIFIDFSERKVHHSINCIPLPIIQSFRTLEIYQMKVNSLEINQCNISMTTNKRQIG